MKPYNIQQLRQAWLDAALAEWQRGVRDDDGGIVGDRDIITGYFTACRWGWHVPGGYVERPDNPWCGIGLAAMGLRIGDYIEPGLCVPVCLDPDIAYWTLPSTRRMFNSRKWQAAGSPQPRIWTRRGELFIDDLNGVPRDPAEMFVPGAIATGCTRVYNDIRDEIGGHFIMVEGYDPQKKLVFTVEFNGRGLRGDRTKGEGVVKVARPLSFFRLVYEFGNEHFEYMERR